MRKRARVYGRRAKKFLRRSKRSAGRLSGIERGSHANVQGYGPLFSLRSPGLCVRVRGTAGRCFQRRRVAVPRGARPGSPRRDRVAAGGRADGERHTDGADRGDRRGASFAAFASFAAAARGRGGTGGAPARSHRSPARRVGTQVCSRAFGRPRERRELGGARRRSGSRRGRRGASGCRAGLRSSVDRGRGMERQRELPRVPEVAGDRGGPPVSAGGRQPPAVPRRSRPGGPRRPRLSGRGERRFAALGGVDDGPERSRPLLSARRGAGRGARHRDGDVRRIERDEPGPARGERRPRRSPPPPRCATYRRRRRSTSPSSSIRQAR